MGNLGATEILLILLVVVLLFGGRKIPELMKGIGNGIREFNEAKEKVKSNLEEGMKKEDEKKEQTEEKK